MDKTEQRVSTLTATCDQLQCELDDLKLAVTNLLMSMFALVLLSAVLWWKLCRIPRK